MSENKYYLIEYLIALNNIDTGYLSLRLIYNKKCWWWCCLRQIGFFQRDPEFLPNPQHSRKCKHANKHRYVDINSRNLKNCSDFWKHSSMKNLHARPNKVQLIIFITLINDQICNSQIIISFENFFDFDSNKHVRDISI